MYGDGLIYIKNIDIWKGKLRLTIFDSIEEEEWFVFMPYNEAWRLGNDIMNKVFEKGKEEK